MVEIEGSAYLCLLEEGCDLAHCELNGFNEAKSKFCFTFLVHLSNKVWIAGNGDLGKGMKIGKRANLHCIIYLCTFNN